MKLQNCVNEFKEKEEKKSKYLVCNKSFGPGKL